MKSEPFGFSLRFKVKNERIYSSQEVILELKELKYFTGRQHIYDQNGALNTESV